MKLQGVPSWALAEIWQIVAPLVDAACHRSSGRFTADILRAACERADMQLWIAKDEEGIGAVMITEVFTYPTGLKVCSVIVLTGRYWRRWIGLLADLEAWARGQGCTMIQAQARPGWERVLGWKRPHVMIEKCLATAAM